MWRLVVVFPQKRKSYFNPQCMLLSSDAVGLDSYQVCPTVNILSPVKKTTHTHTHTSPHDENEPLTFLFVSISVKVFIFCSHFQWHKNVETLSPHTKPWDVTSCQMHRHSRGFLFVNWYIDCGVGGGVGVEWRNPPILWERQYKIAILSELESFNSITVMT